MSLWPCFSSRDMASRSVPTSKEVNRPETSTSETTPAWRILIEKFASVTVHALSAGRLFYLWNQEEGGKIPKNEDVCGKERWFGHAPCRAAYFYWRITTRSPRRQLSARPTRTISS